MKLLKQYVSITLGCALMALAFDWFYAPNELTLGGFTGIAQVINFFAPALPVGVTVIVLNAPLFLMSLKRFGKRFLVRSFFAVAVNSIFIDLINAVYTFQPMEKLLGCIYGGVLVGVSLGWLLREEATTGGTELGAWLLKAKIPGISIGTLCLAIAFALLVINYAISKPNVKSLPTIIDAFENGGKNCLSVGIACGMAGIIAGVVTMTGLGQVLIGAIVGLSNGHLIIALVLTMLCCIVLGMGVPTTANYIIMATTCAPILASGMGLNLMAAHMFCFYFGIVADITPPVALAAYAGSAIAKAPPMKTAWNATRLAIAAFIIPYIFAYNNDLIFVGSDVNFLSVASVVISATLGMASIASGLMGYLIRDMKAISRVALVIGGLLMVIPGTVTDLAGLAVLVVVLVLQRIENKKDKAAASV